VLAAIAAIAVNRIINFSWFLLAEKYRLSAPKISSFAHVPTIAGTRAAGSAAPGKAITGPPLRE
jgi:hypothetical protein